MKETFDILEPDIVIELVKIGNVKQIENGVRYLVVEEIQEK
jgi:hypothetical protein